MTEKPSFTTRDKVRCLRRGLTLRRNVYTGRVMRKQMSQEDADREIALMAAILADYDNGNET